jgi:hypothetical protein
VNAKKVKLLKRWIVMNKHDKTEKEENEECFNACIASDRKMMSGRCADVLYGNNHNVQTRDRWLSELDELRPLNDDLTGKDVARLYNLKSSLLVNSDTNKKLRDTLWLRVKEEVIKGDRSVLEEYLREYNKQLVGDYTIKSFVKELKTVLVLNGWDTKLNVRNGGGIAKASILARNGGKTVIIEPTVYSRGTRLSVMGPLLACKKEYPEAELYVATPFRYRPKERLLDFFAEYGIRHMTLKNGKLLEHS